MSRDQAQSRVLLPGFGLPLDLGQDVLKHTFPTALDEAVTYFPMTTLREFTMMALMDQLTDKPNWDKKINDPEIATKWRAEALSMPDIDITEKMVDYCIAELRYKAKLFPQYNAISIFRGDVVKSDTIVPESLRLALIEAVKPLEKVPPRLQDWHPRSDNKVLDLVHPSLFPLVYGRTRVLPHGRTTLDDCIEKCGQGEVIGLPTMPRDFDDWAHKPFSCKFQWLPCEIDISNGGTKITSYINNLHPHKHKDLYELIEQVISDAIPLWNMTLSPHRYPNHRMRITYDRCEFDIDLNDETVGPQRREGESDHQYHARRSDWYDMAREVVQPEPNEFQEYPSELLVDLRKEFAESGLQVIVKLANIVLTPEKPSYEGGSWHVEGQLNEHICATALYYYDNENVTPSYLAFRQRVSDEDADEVSYPQGEDEWLTEVFGCNNQSSTVQEVGKIETKQGRLLTFPNVLQHQVQPFELADPTKPGHRKILALFLVDPQVKIISTANIPCQRRDWWKEAIQESLKKDRQVRLPLELQELILDDVEELTLSMQEAKELRLKLMNERTIFQTTQNTLFNYDQFNLCEH